MKQSQNKKRPLFITLMACLIFFFVVIFFIPSILSSKAAANFIVNKIEKDLNAKVDIDSFHFSWLGPQKVKKLSFSDSNLDLNVNSISSNMSFLSFYKSTKSFKNLKFFANTQIDNLNVTFHLPNTSQANFYDVYALIKADVKGINSLQINGKTKENSTIGDFTINSNFENNKIISDVIAKNIPTIGLDQLLFFKKPNLQYSLYQILGPTFDMKLKSNLQDLKGPIDIDLKSTNAIADLNLFYQNGNITLTNPANIRILLSPINPAFLKQFNYLASDRNYPIDIYISNQGFFLPLKNFKIQNLKIDHLRLNLNKLNISNTSVINTLTNFAKLGSSNIVNMWFTYVNLKVENGMLYSDRMDFLIDNSIHLCTWGKLDLINKQYRANLGITADTLANVFGIQNLPDDYVIKIPIKGSFDKPKIDTTKATAKIVGLSTLQNSSGIGSIIGGVITQLKSDDDIPPPKLPYPWGSVRRSSSPAIEMNNLMDFFR